MLTSDPFDLYLRQLIHLGHDRHWLRRNESALQLRFKQDDRPFPPPPPPPTAPRDRYEEL